MSTTVITKLYDRLDRICHKHYGSANNGIVEFVLEANPGIELEGILLPAGIEVILPDRPPAPAAVPVVMPNTWRLL